jgi:uncharacterized membrane protein YeiH
MIDTVFLILEIIGVISFAISGALVAIDRETDWFGVIFLATITTFGGGILRDLIIGRNPPAFFTSMPLYVIVCILTAFVVFILAAIFKTQYIKNEEAMVKINNIIDAMGIAVFAVSGVKITMDFCGAECNAFLAIMMGMFSAIGGGMMRDLILRDIPFVLCKRIYALATLAGSTVYYVFSVHIFSGSDFGEITSQIIGVAACFTIRVLATVFKLNMPRAINFEKLRREIERKSKEDEQSIEEPI